MGAATTQLKQYQAVCLSHTVAGTSKGVTVTNNSGHTSDVFVTFDVQGFIP